MIEVAERPRIRPARRRTEPALVALVRRLDWILLLAAAGLVGYGLWVVSGITRFDVPGDESYFVVRQGVAAGARRRRDGHRDARADRPRPPLLARGVRGDPRAHARRVRRRGDDSRLEALARPRSHPVPAVRARQGAVRARHRRFPRGAGRARDAVAHDRVGARPRRRADRARLPPARPRDGPRVRDVPARDPLLRWCPLATAARARAWSRRSRSPPCSGSSRPPASRS